LHPGAGGVKPRRGRGGRRSIATPRRVRRNQFPHDEMRAHSARAHRLARDVHAISGLRGFAAPSGPYPVQDRAAVQPQNRANSCTIFHLVETPSNRLIRERKKTDAPRHFPLVRVRAVCYRGLCHEALHRSISGAAHAGPGCHPSQARPTGKRSFPVRAAKPRRLGLPNASHRRRSPAHRAGRAPDQRAGASRRRGQDGASR